MLKRDYRVLVRNMLTGLRRAAKRPRGTGMTIEAALERFAELRPALDALSRLEDDKSCSIAAKKKQLRERGVDVSEAVEVLCEEKVDMLSQEEIEQEIMRMGFPHIEWWSDHYEKGKKKLSVDENEAWIYNGKVYVYREPTVNAKCVPLVIQGIKDMISEVGLPFLVEDKGVLSDRERMDVDLGRVYIYGRLVRDPKYWGWSDCFGDIELQLPGSRQRPVHYEFLPKISKHETGHFLYPNIGDHGPNPSKEYGYKDNGDCVMHFHAPESYLCDRCRGALVFFWKGLEEATGTKFLENFK